jgi:L-2-hydroxyglutarate oxidase LhgO
MIKEKSTMHQVDCIVVGAGVVGLAVARALALAGREVLVLEAADAIGTGTSSRNSEVIHAGIYYAACSLKARLCVSGNPLLYAYSEANGVVHKRCGKLIVASTADQVQQLQDIADQAKRNGVTDLILLAKQEAQQLEPQLLCEAALLSPSTGIVDSHALMLAMQADLENAGGAVVLRTVVDHVTLAIDGMALTTVDGTRLRCKVVVNAAGLQAPALARQFSGLAPEHVPSAFFAKGNYFALSGKAPFSHLIYPVPEAAGLGVHLTLDLGDRGKFGPDVQWVETADDLRVDPQRGDVFYQAVRRYWPGLQDGSLLPAYAGIRPKISGAHQPACDFVIQGSRVHGQPGLINLFGIESPGLTSSLAIGQEVLLELKILK